MVGLNRVPRVRIETPAARLARFLAALRFLAGLLVAFTEAMDAVEATGAVADAGAAAKPVIRMGAATAAATRVLAFMGSRSPVWEEIWSPM